MRLLALRAETMQAMRRLKLPCDDITPIGLWGSDMYLIGVNNDQFEVLRLWNVQTEDVTPATLRDLHTESTAIPTSPSAGNAASGARSSARGAPSAASASTTSVPEQSTSARSARSAPVTPASESAPAAASPAAPLAQLEREEEPPELSATRGRPSLDIQPVFESVVQSAAPEAPTARSSSSGSRGEATMENGSAGTPGVASASGGSARRDGPDLKLESSAGTAAQGPRPQEGRPTKSSKESSKEAPKDAAKDAKDGGSNAGKLRMTVDGEHLYAEIKGGKIVLKDRTYDSLAHARDSIRRERNKVAVWEYFDEGVKAWRVLNRD